MAAVGTYTGLQQSGGIDFDVLEQPQDSGDEMEMVSALSSLMSLTKTIPAVEPASDGDEPGETLRGLGQIKGEAETDAELASRRQQRRARNSTVSSWKSVSSEWFLIDLLVMIKNRQRDFPFRLLRIIDEHYL